MKLISANGPEYNKLLGVARIYNDGTGTPTVGNYEAMFSRSGAQSRRLWRKSKVHGFRRQRLGGWDLLYRALHNAVGDRS